MLIKIIISFFKAFTLLLLCPLPYWLPHTRKLACGGVEEGKEFQLTLPSGGGEMPGLQHRSPALCAFP